MQLDFATRAQALQPPRRIALGLEMFERDTQCVRHWAVDCATRTTSNGCGTPALHAARTILCCCVHKNNEVETPQTHSKQAVLRTQVLDDYCAGLLQERDLLQDGRAWPAPRLSRRTRAPSSPTESARTQPNTPQRQTTLKCEPTVPHSSCATRCCFAASR